MQTQQITTRFKTNIENAPSEFKISSSEKAFKILSNQLYSNKIRAVIRELSTNAYDAHIYIDKKDIPFEVKLPSNDSLWFEVKDYGPGLSPDDIYNLYTTYFDSNKTESNDYIGALGLGSKSPFAYTDSFNIISKYDGEEIHYTCFLNDRGIPSVMEIHRRDMEDKESTGITVNMAVHKHDITNFVQEATTVFRPFDTKPIIGGHPNFQIMPYGNEKIFLQTNNVTLYESKGGYSQHSIYIKYGCVEYSINLHDIDPYQLNRDLWSNTRPYIVVLNVPIGQLEVAPSRESLSYDKYTIANLKKIIDNAIVEIANSISVKFKDFSTDYERIKYYYSLHYLMSIIKKYGGDIIEEYFDNKMTYTRFIKNISAKDLKDDREYVKAISKESFMFEPNYKNTSTVISKRDFFDVGYNNSFLYNNYNGTYFYYVDIKDKKEYKKAVRNFKEYLRNAVKLNSVHFLITNKKLFEVIGNPSYKNLSDIPYQKKEFNEDISNSGKLVQTIDYSTDKEKVKFDEPYNSLYSILPKDNKKTPIYVYVIKAQGKQYVWHEHSDAIQNYTSGSIVKQMDTLFKKAQEVGILSGDFIYIPVVIKRYLFNLKEFQKDNRFMMLYKVMDAIASRVWQTMIINANYYRWDGFEYITDISTYNKSIDEAYASFTACDELKNTRLEKLWKSAHKEYEQYNQKGNRNEIRETIVRLIKSMVNRYYISKYVNNKSIKLPAVDTFFRVINKDYSMLMIINVGQMFRYTFNENSLDKKRIIDYILMVENCIGGGN